MKLVLAGPVYPYRGGIAHYTTMLCQALREQGHDVLLVSFKRQYPKWLFPGRSDKDPSKKPLEVEGTQYWIDSLNPITWLVAFWRIRQYRPDALILPWWTTFWAPAWFVLGVLNRLFMRRPLIYICHNVLPHEVQWWDPWVVRLVLRWGTRFIVQSTEEKKRLADLIPGAQIAVVPHPVYDMFANERIPKEEARRRLGLPFEVPVLLFFGIVREYKGLQDVLTALPEIRARLERVILLVAGEFWEDKERYLAMIERLGVSDSVIIEDRYIPNEEVALYFSAADVLVAPYRRMTGSGAVQMAQGFGLPAIRTDIQKPRCAAARDEAVLPTNSETLAVEVVHFFTEETQSRVTQKTGPDQVSSWKYLVDQIAGDAV